MLYTYGKGGEQKRSIYPVNSRASTNKDDLSVIQLQSGKPNPIKHWRKQLQPYYANNSTKVTISDVENPSTTTISSISECQNNAIYTQVISTPNCDGINTETGCKGGTANIRRSGSTIYGPNYCSSTRQYLQRRCKSFEQNMMVGKVVNADKNTYLSTQGDNNTCIVYKTNNGTFNTIDSVVASNFISKRRTDAINQNKYNPNKKLEQSCVLSCNQA
jgi:hypothetical protein